MNTVQKIKASSSLMRLISVLSFLGFGFGQLFSSSNAVDSQEMIEAESNIYPPLVTNNSKQIDSLPVTLTIKNKFNSFRSAEPVTSGVPLYQGILKYRQVYICGSYCELVLLP